MRERVSTNQAFSSSVVWAFSIGCMLYTCRPEPPHCRPQIGVRRHFFMRIDEEGPRQKVRCLSPWPSSFTWRRGARQPERSCFCVNAAGKSPRPLTHARLAPVDRMYPQPPSLPLATLHTCPAHAPPAHVPPAFLCVSLRRFSVRRVWVLPADMGPGWSPNARVMHAWPTLPHAPFAHAPLLVPSCY